MNVAAVKNHLEQVDHWGRPYILFIQLAIRLCKRAYSLV